MPVGLDPGRTEIRTPGDRPDRSTRGEMGLERAARAPCLPPQAVLLAHPHKERVVFVIQGGVPRQRGLDLPAHRFVGLAAIEKTVPAEDAAGVGVNHENRMARRIQDNGVGGLRPDTGHAQQLFPQVVRRQAQKPFKTAVMAPLQQSQERLQLRRLLVEIAGRTDQSGQA